MQTSQINVDAADADRLATQLSDTHLHQSTGDGNETGYGDTPDTTNDKQLPILGGGASLPLGEKNQANFDSDERVRNATSTHLDHPAAHSSPIASSSYTAPPSLSQSLATYVTRYNAILARDFSSNALRHVPLPSNMQVLEELSVHMADKVYSRFRMGGSPVLPPLGHPCYPFWVPEHGVNHAIEAVVKGEREEGQLF